jgi:hypothetical protein
MLQQNSKPLRASAVIHQQPNTIRAGLPRLFPHHFSVTDGTIHIDLPAHAIAELSAGAATGRAIRTKSRTNGIEKFVALNPASFRAQECAIRFPALSLAVLVTPLY